MFIWNTINYDVACTILWMEPLYLRRIQLCLNFAKEEFKNDRNGGVWQSRISKSLAECVQRHVCFVNEQLFMHENVVFSVCARMDNAAYIIFIMWNSISGLESWNHFRFNISCGVAVTVRSHQKNFR